MATSQTGLASTPWIPKRVHACDFCRAKKIRCPGDDPCSNCVECEVQCHFTPRQRRERKKRDGLPSLRRRLAHFEDLLETAKTSSIDDNPLSLLIVPDTSTSQQEDRVHQRPPSDSLSDRQRRDRWEVTRQKPQAASDAGQSHRAAREDLDSSWHHRRVVSPQSLLPTTVTKTSSHHGSTEAPWERLDSPSQSANMVGLEDTGGYHTFEKGIEYWGPRTHMSICSSAGIAWVEQRVKQPDFRLTANRFTQDIASRLKLEKRVSKERMEEPGLEDALTFTRAYFEEASDAPLGIVRRSCFESRLRSFYRSSQTDDDTSWYAMRNIIFASGCRVVLSREGTYAAAQRGSWPYFENALSVHSELLYLSTSMMGVQVLTLMVLQILQHHSVAADKMQAYFAEALSCRMLQYMLVANAYRLACGQGLQTQPAPSWNLSQEDKSLRQCVFWAIYGLDKQIACRSGRPSVRDSQQCSAF